MSAFLLEIGVEELPAGFIHAALAAMPGLAEKALADARLQYSGVRALGSPRRLALLIDDLADRQADLAEDVMGPPKSAAFEADGKPKKAAEGFARKLGVPLEALRIVATDKGEYLMARREVSGLPAQEVLSKSLARLCSQIPFAKSMRWADLDVPFGRPVQWLVALHGDRIVDFEFAGARAGRRTRGHRFLAPDQFELGNASEYVDRLRTMHVLVDPTERTRVMSERLIAAAKSAGGTLVDDAFLVTENASLVEEPQVIAGSFDAAFLDLPPEVIIAVMRGHQRYFAVRSPQGKLLPRYLAVLNTMNAPEVITRGNDSVLRARLKDAQFFVKEDRKHTLEQLSEKLAGVVFQAKLGSVQDRRVRLMNIVAQLGGTDEDRTAAALCKVDLVTLIVGEFPELQGTMGAYYAQAEGIGASIAVAIRDHYLPRGAADGVPTQPISARLAIADRADLLVGCFGVGLVPTASADPLGLRRAALGIARIAMEGTEDVDLRRVLSIAWDAYAAGSLAPKPEVIDKLDEFFRGRLRVYLAERHPADLVEACLGAWQGASIRDLAARIAALEAFRKNPAYESLTVAFKRAYNIAKDAPHGDPDPALFTEDAERELFTRFAAARGRIESAVGAGRYEQALSIVAGELREPIDRFFEKVFVMVDDVRVRDNRLRLLGAIARMLTAIAHFHLLGS